MKNLIKKILKESDLEWAENIINKPVKIESSDFRIGDTIEYHPTMEYYKDQYDKCQGRIYILDPVHESSAHNIRITDVKCWPKRKDNMTGFGWRSGSV